MKRKQTPLEIEHAAKYAKQAEAIGGRAQELYDLLRYAIQSYYALREPCGAVGFECSNGAGLHCCLSRNHGGRHWGDPKQEWIYPARKLLRDLEAL